MSASTGLSQLLDCAGFAEPAAPEAAILALLRAMGLGPSSRVALPVWGSAGLAEMLVLCDYDVVPLDVDPETGRLDVSSVARAQEDFELLWMHDVNGVPPEGPRLAALARSRDALVVEEVRESLGTLLHGAKPGAHADAVMLRLPDGRAQIGSASRELALEADRNLPRFERGGHEPARARSGQPELPGNLAATLKAQRRVASLYESAWSSLRALGLPGVEPGCLPSWPRYPVRILSEGGDYPNAAWSRWLRTRKVRTVRPSMRLVHGLEADDAHVRRNYPGAVEYLRRVLYFPCEASISITEVRRTVLTVDELARKEWEDAA